MYFSLSPVFCKHLLALFLENAAVVCFELTALLDEKTVNCNNWRKLDFETQLSPSQLVRSALNVFGHASVLWQMVFIFVHETITQGTRGLGNTTPWHIYLRRRAEIAASDPCFIWSSSSSLKKEKMSQNLLQWTVADVASYFSAAGFPEQAVAFRTQVNTSARLWDKTSTDNASLRVFLASLKF